jgi:hypothetical protein
MSNDRRSDGVQGLYGMLLGGLIASLVGLVVFTLFWGDSVNGSGGGPVQTTTIALVGLACAGVLMLAGMVVTDDLPWLAGGLLFSSGFTAIWSVAMSFSIGAKWVPITGLALAIAMGIGLGRWKWGRQERDQPGMRPSPIIPTTSSTSTMIESIPTRQWFFSGRTMMLVA